MNYVVRYDKSQRNGRRGEVRGDMKSAEVITWREDECEVKRTGTGIIAIVA